MCEQVDRQLEDLKKFRKELMSDTMEITEVEDESGATITNVTVDDVFERESGPGYTMTTLETITQEASRRGDDFERLKSWTETLLEEVCFAFDPARDPRLYTDKFTG